MANNVEDLIRAVSELPTDQLCIFRAWYEKFDANTRNEQLEDAATTGKLDALAKAALADHQAGRSCEL